ncbi:nuclear envelope phosphatase-regulatory subunit 1-like isoform X3 [Octopus sinensis]|uniref:Transmembrane protein 188 n=1 Tax=Octopus sinensis TaxID=2607531 RepID=A0A6P7STV2_9MOLL|nr:nuclear envelope phosphatase-regulatory subunit 1-like isoform X3 [Octopus sinensis]
MMRNKYSDIQRHPPNIKGTVASEDDYVRTLQDLKAFERRLTEVIDKLQPAARFWRIILIIISVCTAIGAWAWLWDPATAQISFIQSLWNHPFFTISCITLFALFMCGIHKRVVAPSIVASRCRQVLSDYNMSCDDTGKLILLKPRPSI